MHRAGQKSGAVLIVFLQPEIGLNQALQNLVAIGAEMLNCRHTIFEFGRQAQKSGQGSTSGRLEQDGGFERAGMFLEDRKIAPIHQEEMPPGVSRTRRRQPHPRIVVPQIEVRAVLDRGALINGSFVQILGQNRGNAPVTAGVFSQDILTKPVQLAIFGHQFHFHCRISSQNTP